MKRFSTFIALLLCAVSTILADGPFRNHRYDSFKALSVTSDNILFIGNSITDMHCWPEVFVTSNGDYLPIVNRGNSGTYSTEQSDNLESYINGKPKKVFMMIGTNDIATSGGLNFSPEQVLAYVKSIVARIHARSPQTKVYLYSILKNRTGNRVEATWLKANELTKAYADATEGVTYIDLYDKLAGVADGGAWSYDNLHLTAGAYQAWASTICEYLAEGEDYTVSCVYPKNTLSVQNAGGLNGSNGMRATYFSALPISSEDVLVFGDEFIKNGEWQELLGNPNVKNRGTGWGYGGDIATTSKLVDATYASIDGVSKADAKAIFLYTGTGDCNGSTDMATVKENYKALVDKIAEKSPTSKIYLMALCPTNNASNNTNRIAALKDYMVSLATANATDNLEFVDTYTPYLNGEMANTKYFYPSNYLGGLGYAKMAVLMKEALDKNFPGNDYTVTSEADAEARYNQATLRNQLTQVIARGLVAQRGDAAGQYNVAKMAAFDTKVSEANALLEKSNITQEEVTTFANALNEILNGALSMPTNSTQGNEVWYQLYTPNRSNKYLSSHGDGVNGVDKNNYASSMWKFVARNDGSLDIINRNDNSYLAPTAAYNKQITTSATQPANGWTLSYANTPGLFIISSGTVQLNQTTSDHSFKVYNWSSGQSGTDRGDAGGQYMITLVEGTPEVEPMVPTDENFKNVVTAIENLTDGWYKMRVVTGSDATMQGYVTSGVNNILNANSPFRQSATNFYPLKIGAYNTAKPATGWVKVKKIGSKYLIQSIDGLAIQENCIASRDITQGYTTLTMSYGGYTSVDKWHYYNPGANTEQPYIGKSSSSNNKFAFAPVGDAELAAYDIYTVTIDAENATEIGSDPSITYTGSANIGGIAKVYNNGYMFFPKGTVPVATDFTLPEGLSMKVNASAKTLTVGVFTDGVETLTLTPNDHFANASGKATWTHHGESGGAWYGKFVTSTTPALAVESPDNAANNIGYSNNRPWLKAGYTYNLTLPEGYEFVGYELTTLSTSSGYTNTFTYTTAEGTGTSAAQSNTTEKTVSADNLATRSIALTVNGTAGGSNYGILITRLVISYKEVSEEEVIPTEFTYTIDKENGDLYRDGNVNNDSWTSAWKSKDVPQLQFGTGKNNMNWHNNNVQLMTGGTSSRYTLTAPAGYVISEYSFTFANNGHDNAQEIIMDNGDVYATSTTPQTVSAQKQRLTSLYFDLNGPNSKGVVLSNFVVKLKLDVAEAPKVSTADNVYWYYITSAASNDGTAYCAGKVMYYDAETQKLRFADKDFKPNYIWSFWEQNGKLAIKNYSGQYFGTAPGGTGGGTSFGVVDQANYIYNINEAHGFFVIKDNNTELHAQSSGQTIVRWGAAAGNASLWRFDEVDVTNAEANVAGTRVVQGKVSTGIGNVDQAIIRSTIRVTGLQGTVNFEGVKGRFEGDNAADVTNVKAYFATNDRELFIDATKKMTWREENGVQYGATVQLAQDGTFTITGTKEMAPGNYYLWITYDIAESAKEGNLVDAQITSYTVDGAEIAEANGNPQHSVTIFLSEGAVLMPMDKGSLHYRIPAITATKDGKRLVVLTDDRKQSQADLPNHCYVVAQYSDDMGKTWSDPVTVAGTAETGGNYGHGDASIVTNRDNGDIIGIVTSAGTYGHGFFQGTAQEPPRWKTITSHDGGVTWDVPVDHTDDLFGANCDNPDTKTWKSGFSGSGAALQKRDGTLVSNFVNRQEDNSQHFYFFMSKDGGKNWYVSGTSGTASADEPKSLERNNGDLAISVRASGYNYHNVTSNDGATWRDPSQTRFNTGISGNACDGEYMVWCSTLEGNPWNIALQTLPNSSSRENVSIALSTDEGETFGAPKTICPRGSCYSATVVLPDGTLGVYYEENGVSNAFVMRFVRFSLDWASNGTYKFTEEAPFKPIASTAAEKAKVESTISAQGIGTFYANAATEIPEGVTAYVATTEPEMEEGEGVLTMTQIEDGIIPAKTGVVVRGAAGEKYDFFYTAEDGATETEGNMLRGYAGAAEYKDVALTDGVTSYVLTVQDGVTGFFRKEAGFKVYNHKAYLNVPETAAALLSIRFAGNGDTTGIDNATIVDGNATPVIYDLSGRRVENATKGVYIVNGKKVIF